MIEIVKGNIFESDSQTIVNAVNCVGVMGGGIALEFKNRYPEMFLKYRDICSKKLLSPGKLHLWKSDTKWILNFPTKNHFRNPSEIEFIEEGLKKFVDTYEEKGITSISFPLLGSGLGGLDWETEVKPLMFKYLSDLNIDIKIYIYQ